MNLRHDHIYLRAVEPSDASLLLMWENNPQNWKISGTEIPFSLHAIHEFIANGQDFRRTGQLRLMICLNEGGLAIGCVDLYDGDFKNRRAGLGILIGSDTFRGKGYGSEAIELTKDYAAKIFDFHPVYCLVDEDNFASIKLFEKSGFEKSGVLKDWFCFENKWRNVIQFQFVYDSPSHESLTKFSIEP